MINASNASFAHKYLAGEWIGLEVAVDLGTAGNSNGSIEVWFYDESGNEFGHFLRNNINRLQGFDHYNNKVVLGGNRFGKDYDPDPGDSDENRYYADDFIIHGSRIGPTYFNLLNNNPPPPPTPGDLTGDGLVDILDLQAYVNHVLSMQHYGATADVNGDGQTNVLDIQFLVGMILGD